MVIVLIPLDEAGYPCVDGGGWCKTQLGLGPANVGKGGGNVARLNGQEVLSDGTPTELYREFRNPKKSRLAVGKAFRKLYQRLYEMNEYVHDAGDQEILGLIVECTGGEKDSQTTKLTLYTLNMLRKISDFDDGSDIEEAVGTNTQSSSFQTPQSLPQIPATQPATNGKGINLSYTINLNLPATKDVEVFNAIFKSLKEHILGG